MICYPVITPSPHEIITGLLYHIECRQQDLIFICLYLVLPTAACTKSAGSRLFSVACCLLSVSIYYLITKTVILYAAFFGRYLLNLTYNSFLFAVFFIVLSLLSFLYIFHNQVFIFPRENKYPIMQVAQLTFQSLFVIFCDDLTTTQCGDLFRFHFIPAGNSSFPTGSFKVYIPHIILSFLSFEKAFKIKTFQCFVSLFLMRTLYYTNHIESSGILEMVRLFFRCSVFSLLILTFSYLLLPVSATACGFELSPAICYLSIDLLSIYTEIALFIAFLELSLSLFSSPPRRIFYSGLLLL